MHYGGDFVIYLMWGRFQFPEGQFLKVRRYSNSELISNIRTTFSTSEPNYLMQFQLHVRNKGYKAQDIGMVVYNNN